MSSISSVGLLSLSSSSFPRSTAFPHHQVLLPQPSTCFFIGGPGHLGSRSKRFAAAAAGGTLTTKSVPSRNGVYTVGDFMTRKEALHVVKPTTTVDEALEALVEHRITGFPVIDDDWKLVGLVSDLICWRWILFQALHGMMETSFLRSTALGKYTFNEVQKLLSKTNGQVVGDLMTPAPLVVRESTNLEDAARLLLQTKYRRLPVVDADGRLVGIITRGNVVRAALQIKRSAERKA